MLRWRNAILLALLAISAHANDTLTSTGYRSCQDDADLQISTLEASFDKSSSVITFNIAGVSIKSQEVSAILTVSAYGQQVYQNQFNPCDYGIKQLCPIPATPFAAQGNQTIPEGYANLIPAIAYSLPDLDGLIKLQILQASTDQSVGCIEASITNGKTVRLPLVEYVGNGIAAAAFLASGLAAVLSGAQSGAATASPTFGETMGWFQSMAMNGMLSVNYPSIYRSFTSDFGFSTGLVSWPSLERTIDNFRASTGGKLTNDSYDNLQTTSLTYSVRRTPSSILTRDGTASNSLVVSGIQAYAEQLAIPQANTFMTLLLVFALVIAGLMVVILLLKGMLELWARMRPLSKSLDSWRRRYWWRLIKAITSLIIIFYGVWTMYSIYQFTNGDSWAAKLLAALSLGLFTLLLASFIFRIVHKARQLERIDGSVSKLYEDKETWMKYSLFYDSFRRTYWWMFIPLLLGGAARGVIIAGANGHGLVQTIGHIAIDTALLVLLIWTQPYQLRSGNIINIVMQVVRVLSVACILVFVEELGVSQTAKTIAGFALIIIQSVLTGLLAILLAVNALVFCIRENPERRRRKQTAKMDHDYEDRDSLLMGKMVRHAKALVPQISKTMFGDQRGGYGPVPNDSSSGAQHTRWPSDTSSPSRSHSRNHSRDNLLPHAAGMGWEEENGRPHATHRVSDLSLYEQRSR